MRRRVRKTRAQRRALACVLLMQRAYLGARTAVERLEFGEMMSQLAREAKKIDAFTVYVETNR